MARKTVLTTAYTFTPSTKTIVVPKVIPQERLILITNVTTGQVIFNFADPTLRATTYLTYVTPGIQWLASTTYAVNAIVNNNNNVYYVSTGGTSGTTPPTHTSGTVAATGGTASYTFLSAQPVLNTEQTLIVLNANTTAMSATDKLQIVVDDFVEKFEPAEAQMDPTNKLRVTTPQSLIDTDFEYGTQTTKWESLGLTNNRPFAPVGQIPVANVSDITFAQNARVVTVTLAAGTTATATNVNGNFPTAGIATYTTSAAHNFQPGQWVLIAGAATAGFNGRYLITSVPTTTTFTVTNYTSGTGVTFTSGTAAPSSPPAGTPIQVLDTLLFAANGNFIIETTPTANTFTYTAKAVNTSSAITSSIFDFNRTVLYFSQPYSHSSIVMTGVPTVSGTDLRVTVTTAVPHGLSIGNEIAVGGVGGTNPPNGNFTVASVASPTTFVYYANGTTGNPSALALDATRGTGSYTGSSITTSSPAPGFITIAATAAHNLQPGQWVTIAGTTNYNGSYQVLQTPTATTFVVANNSTAATTWGTPAAGIVANPWVYARAQSTFNHRAFDGGVLFSTNTASNYVQATRQTRRYFRYQSGKGVQISTGTIMRPYATIDSITSSGTTVTVRTREQHNLQAGTTIAISGCNETAYNGTFGIAQILGPSSFTYTALSTPSSPTASGSYAVSVVSWFGAVNRLGVFDQQNGLFFEFDGQQLWAVRRNSVYQLSGRSTVTQGSSTITQTSAEYPTSYSRQLTPGDFVSIRGMSYRIIDIASDTSMTISPAYRGATATNVVINRTTDLKIPQSQWNIDRCDGTGPSGYTLDLSKMQMFYIDFTWYGAGFIRYGVRGPNGDVIYVHKIANNNLNSEAYMRSGNLPARYESATIPPLTTTTATVGTSDTTMNVVSTAAFPTSGLLLIRDGSHYEYVNYTGKTATTFTGLTRQQAGSAVGGVTFTAAIGAVTGTVSSATGLQIGQRAYGTGNPNAIPDGTFITAIAGTTVTLSQPIGLANPTVIFAPMQGASSAAAFTFSATAPIPVELAQPTFAPAVSHWGTSVIMDGRYDDDKSLIFTYGQTNFTSVGGTLGSLITVGAPTTTTTLSLGTTATASNVVAGQTVTGTNIAANTIVTTNPVTTVYNITAISGSGTVVTYSTSNTANLVAGQVVTITGATTAGYNGVFTVASVVANTNFTVSSTVTGTGSTARATLVTVTLNQNTSGAVSGLGSFSGATSKALFSIRVAPSVDNGIVGAFGQRELVNRMQLVLRSLDVTTRTATSNFLVRAFLNATPSTYVNWTNAIGAQPNAVTGTVNSSLAQIADYSAATSSANTWVFGGEVTAGFFVNSTTSIDLSAVRDLGTSILGNGSPQVNSGGTTLFGSNGTYPDGPDTLTIVVTNLNESAVDVTGRLGWTEAQA
jgi:hypothetical protein